MSKDLFLMLKRISSISSMMDSPLIFPLQMWTNSFIKCDDIIVTRPKREMNQNNTSIIYRLSPHLIVSRDDIDVSSSSLLDLFLIDNLRPSRQYNTKFDKAFWKSIGIETEFDCFRHAPGRIDKNKMGITIYGHIIILLDRNTNKYVRFFQTIFHCRWESCLVSSIHLSFHRRRAAIQKYPPQSTTQ